MNPFRIFRLSPHVLAILGLATSAFGVTSATITGRVTDPSGAVVPGTKITATNVDTNVSSSTLTNEVGLYVIPDLPPGRYRVIVQKQGFETIVKPDVVLHVADVIGLNFSMQVGSISQSMTVQGGAPLIQTETTQLGDVIGGRTMTSLPLNGRSYVDLLGLQAGVVPSQLNTGFINTSDRPVSGTLSAGNVSVNGQREASNSFLVNGGDVEEGKNNGTSIIPVLDSIQEFRLLTNAFDAEYGRFSGAVVNVVTKSGTNALHGSIFEFLRNDKLDSRNFFDRDLIDPVSGHTIPGSARAAPKRNQFGGTAGGPILKNRFFFFGDYQGTREVVGVSTGVINVPSAQERNGDFTDVDAVGYPQLTGTVRGDSVPGNHTMDEVLSQRLGYAVKAGEPYWVSGCNTAADAQAGTCVFPGQVIPQSAWTPVAIPTLKFIPNAIGATQGTPFFSTSANKRTVRDDKFGARIDLNTQKRGGWRFYYHLDDSQVGQPYPSANVPGFPGLSQSRAQQANLSHTLSLGTSAVNEARLNFTRTAMNLNKPGGGLGKVSSFGFADQGLGIIPVSSAYEGLPVMFFDSLGLGVGVPSDVPSQFNNTWHVTDNFSKIFGRHATKFGADFRYYQINVRLFSSGNGLFDFDGSETGNDFADFLLGAPSYFEQSSILQLDSRTRYYAVFAQDAFKIRPNLTLNYGVRWEVNQPWYDTQGKIEQFVPGRQSRVFPDAPLGWVFPGDPGIPSTLAKPQYDRFAPRLGIAYSPEFSGGILGTIFGGPGKTSIRAAYGLTTQPWKTSRSSVKLATLPSGFSMSAPRRSTWRSPTRTASAVTTPGSASLTPSLGWAQRASGENSCPSPSRRHIRSTT